MCVSVFGDIITALFEHNHLIGMNLLRARVLFGVCVCNVLKCCAGVSCLEINVSVCKCYIYASRRINNAFKAMRF